jgi:hypothetical protein
MVNYLYYIFFLDLIVVSSIICIEDTAPQWGRLGAQQEKRAFFATSA